MSMQTFRPKVILHAVVCASLIFGGICAVEEVIYRRIIEREKVSGTSRIISSISLALERARGVSPGHLYSVGNAILRLAHGLVPVQYKKPGLTPLMTRLAPPMTRPRSPVFSAPPRLCGSPPRMWTRRGLMDRRNEADTANEFAAPGPDAGFPWRASDRNMPVAARRVGPRRRRPP
jgi:hypothetical protein